MGHYLGRQPLCGATACARAGGILFKAVYSGEPGVAVFFNKAAKIAYLATV